MTYSGTRTDCRTVADLSNRVAGYPLRGRHVGGGIHGPMPEAVPIGWDVTQPVPPGWTAYSDAAIEVDGTRFRIEGASELDDPELVSTRLTTTEQTTLTTVRQRGTVSATEEETRIR